MKHKFEALAILALSVFLAPQAMVAQKRAATEVSSETASAVPSRVVSNIDDARLTRLTGNTHPLAQPKFDKGPVDPGKMLQRIVLVLKRSPEQEAALAAFNERQYNPKSPDFHHWLHADEFGRLYGVNDADISQVTNWLQNHGFTIHEVSNGRVWIQFDGTVKQVEDAFHLQMRNYLVDGKMHIANDRDPQIPEALSPVITGIASLHDFSATHFSHPGAYVRRDLKTGKYTVLPPATTPHAESASTIDGQPGSETKSFATKNAAGRVQPQLGYVDANTGYQREELSPYDVATIYNILPLWNSNINGKGVKVAIVALSDVVTSDFNTFRSSFGLPAGTLTTVHSGADPGVTDSQGENTEDVEMVSATAPGATVVLVSDVSNATTDGLVTAVTYIVDKEVAPILTMSYGACELKLGTSGNSLYNQTFQQAATSGISSFVAAGDSGSGVCTTQNGTPPYADQYGLAVSGMASTPYVTAVGGTDLQWPLVEATHPISTYWNSTNDSHGASAKGYMPEMAWNDTCTNPLLLNVFTETSNEELCNDAINGDAGLVEMAGGSGGKSSCTTNSTTDSSTTFNPASCSGGYAKPSWQTGVTGIPSDGKRDIPDVSMFAAYGFQQSTGIPGSALLVCQASDNPANSCDYSNPNYITYQENGGTSAASPLTAGIMALVLQKTGGANQGLANPVFYSLAAKETYGNCNTNTVKAGNSCIFYDTTSGSNAAVCYTGDPNCVTKTSGDQAGILSGYSTTTGYDLATGLGSFNVANLVNAWPATTSTTPTLTLSPSSLTFASTKVGVTSAAQTVTLKNTGKSSITLGSTSFSGTNASSFVQSSSNCPGTVAAGASCTVNFEFKPTAAGSLSATWSIADNASGSPQKVSLAGTATSGTSTITVTLSPTSLTFPSTKVGATSSAQSFTLKNTGTASVTLGSVSITGTNASSFTQSSTNCPGTVAAGASCTVSLEFKPTTTGTLTATWALTDNASNSPQKVTLTGTATSGTSTLTVTLSPTSLTFPSTKVGSASSAQSFTLKNTGSTSVTLGSVSITGTNASSFTQSSTNCPGTVAAGASCTVSIEFKPTAAGTLTGTWAITDNASNSPQKVTLTGTGTSASSTLTISLSPSSLTFATTKAGSTSAAQTFTLKNTGTASVTLGKVSFTGTNASSFLQSSTNCLGTVTAGASCTVSLEFKPTTTGSLTATWSIADNASNSPQSVSLKGTGN